ncbi:hypothetical protein U8P73_36045 (plasmid) [Rhizobium beringeri]|uniref:hypothetical protein n=1 Tax=Rhizobium beringeri TaxID=3019934 RepID=UPI002DDD7512|nr:hypothetical protein [Rhizobium beringeri]WSG93563.1 hypothetical protein U8P73_36045 [Rhizobium beringeri]
MSYDLEEHRNGWMFRFPAGEAALWFGPFPSQEAANAAALEAVEEFIAQNVKQALGLK